MKTDMTDLEKRNGKRVSTRENFKELPESQKKKTHITKVMGASAANPMQNHAAISKRQQADEYQLVMGWLA
jgi:hypothetical protein